MVKIFLSLYLLSFSALFAQNSPPSLPQVHCFYETPQCQPLIITPKEEMNLDAFLAWARTFQNELANQLKIHGALVFRGFEISQESFPKAFEAVTGRTPRAYRGDSPRDKLGENVYQSTSVKSDQRLPLHIEEVAVGPTKMANYLSFFCVVPPEEGGQTTLGDVRTISKAIQEQAPDIWQLFSENLFTYCFRFLPNGQYADYVHLLNPSYATIEYAFGTTDHATIEEACASLDELCHWRDDGVLEVLASGRAAVREVDGEMLFHNNVHNCKLSPGLCGNAFYYHLARLLLYWGDKDLQYDVWCDDGTKIDPDVSTRVIEILHKNEIVRDWHEGEMIVIDNVRMMHGKRPHWGNRKIIVAME